MSENQPEESLDEFIESIAPDVLSSLGKQDFFRRLEERVWPDGPDGRKVCDSTYANALILTAADGYTPEDQDDILDVMRSRGGFCDCEIILNAAPESAIRERHWKRVAAELEEKKQ
jgi:hypothetical protein